MQGDNNEEEREGSGLLKSEKPSGPASECIDEIGIRNGDREGSSDCPTEGKGFGGNTSCHKEKDPINCCIAAAAAANKKLRYCIIAIVGLSIAVIILIVLLVIKPETYLPCPSPKGQGVFCPDFWVGYKGKCFYTSKEEGNWSLSLKTCSSLNASLAVIDTQKELEFWVKTFRPFHYWFGLSREVNQVWKWSDGTEFKNQFPVRGEGFCAYLNGKEADSTLCSMEKLFFCSRPES